MDNAVYASLTRQSGLLKEMRVVANNIANINTTGFRREGIIFAEHLENIGPKRETLSMAYARGRLIDLKQGVLKQTNGTYDLAIEGDGFFMVETPDGNRLTRAGSFQPSGEGELMNADGFRLLDEGQAPIIVPANADQVSIGPDGTLSASGIPIGRIGVFLPPEGENLDHQSGTTFVTNGDTQALETPQIRQGFLEESNVDPVFEITRMIEVQRNYELGQSFLQREDERIRSIITAISR